jgi:hypothetical protein
LIRGEKKKSARGSSRRGVKAVGTMKTNDPELSALLRQWRGAEPGPGFAEAVRRRLREDGRAPGLLGWLISHPIWNAAAAAAVGLTIGLSVGVTSHPGRNPAAPPLSHTTSITAGLVQMASGGMP